MRFSTLIASVALLLQLGACAWLLPENPSPQEGAAGAQPSQEPQPPPPAPPRKPPVPTASLAQPNPTPDLPQPNPPPEVTTEPLPQSRVVNPEGLIGLDQGQIETLLGAPEARSDAAPARIWHYDGRNCALEIYFYLDLKSQVMRALHYEVKSNEPSEPTRERCFSDLVARHEAGLSPTGANPPR